MLRLTAMDLGKEKPEILMIPVCEEGAGRDYPELAALIKRAFGYPEFAGELKQKITLYDPPEIPVRRVMLIGMGKRAALDRETVRAAAGCGVRAAIEAGFSRIHMAVGAGMDKADLLVPFMEGAVLANYLPDVYKQAQKKKQVSKIIFLASPALVKKCQVLPEVINTVCAGTLLARHWVNIPSNLKPPVRFAEELAARARQEGLKVTLHDEEFLRENKFGAMLAVASGSEQRPCLLVLEHRPKKAKKTVLLVGKGVVFDSGGINLKPAASMDTMKTDMAGAAAVAATLMAAARLKLDAHIVGVIPLVENMPSGTAVRPGDIVTSYSGKTIEIGNTDAEGRLILADAMAWAQDVYKPDTMLDLATLTGACVTALGEKFAGVFSNDPSLAASLVTAGEKTFERCWTLPMPADYKELLKSELADINNMSSSKYGGAITGALFLSEFAGKTPWAHIDIAGPARNGKASEYCPVGGSGFGVRLLWEFLSEYK